MARVAFVHDWLTGMRGGEKCLERLVALCPDSELFTLLYRRGSVSPTIAARPISATWLDRLPGWERYYRYLLPLFPAAARWDIRACDVVVSLSHCVAKAAVAPPGVPHVCYCFTPMRYAWHQRDAYFGGGRWSPLASARDAVLSRLRDWDRRTAARVSHFIAISEAVRGRIFECYGRDSTVIYPPVDTDYYRPAGGEREDYYLVVSAFAPYKRIDLAIEACGRLGRRLVVIGTGQDERRLRRLAGPGVTFLGWQPDAEIRRHFQRCRALLFPGEEDFGIVPVEAQACGTPVIALGRGGALETVIGYDQAPAAATGVLAAEATGDAITDAIVRFERIADALDPAWARRNAERFAAERFDSAMREFLTRVTGAADTRARAA
jgi:glycosyltransferase involved in cell wall biosynthesis